MEELVIFRTLLTPSAVAVAAVLAVRGWLASLFPLTGDEGFGWLCSRHLAWSYDHPPLQAWINAAAVGIAGDPLWGLRLAAAALTVLTLVVLAGLARAVARTDEGVGVAGDAALLCALVPYTLFVALVPTPELPLALCWVGASLAVVRYLQTARARFAGIAGAWIGLGLLSKLTMLLFPAAVGVFLLLNPEQRRLLRRPAPWVAACLAAAIFAPVVVADLRQGAPMLRFHAGRVGVEPWFVWTLAFVGDQVLYLSPVVVWLALRFARGWRGQPCSPDRRFLIVATATPIIGFLLLSVKTHVWPHWTAAAIAPMAVLAALDLAGGSRRRRQASLVALVVFDLIVAGVLLWWSPGVLRHQRAYRENHALAARAQELARSIGPVRFAADGLAAVAQITYYARVEAVMPTGILSNGVRPFAWNQFDRWNTTPIGPGESLVVFTQPGSPLHEAVRRRFTVVRELSDWRLTTIEGYQAGWRFFLAERFIGDPAKM